MGDCLAHCPRDDHGEVVPRRGGACVQRQRSRSMHSHSRGSGPGSRVHLRTCGRGRGGALPYADRQRHVHGAGDAVDAVVVAVGKSVTVTDVLLAVLWIRIPALWQACPGGR